MICIFTESNRMKSHRSKDESKKIYQKKRVNNKNLIK